MTANRFTISLTLIALSLLLGAPARAALEISEQAFELNAKQILRWPLREGDSIVVRPCDSCNIETLQVTEETRYSIGFDGENILLRDLLRQESLLTNSEDYLVIVFFQPNNGPVTRIILQTEL